jgi:DnaJ-class molecular chaperone
MVEFTANPAPDDTDEDADDGGDECDLCDGTGTLARDGQALVCTDCGGRGYV